MIFQTPEFPLNPTCKMPAVLGKRLNDKWEVYFYYYIDNKRKVYRISQGLNIPKQTITQKRKIAKDIVKQLTEQLNSSYFNLHTKSFQKLYSDISPISELVEEYLAFISPKVVYHTKANYETIFKQFLPLVKDTNVADISKEIIQTFFRQLKVKPQSKRSYRIYLSAFFNWLIDEKGIKISNPTVGLKLPHNIPVERHRIYNQKDLARIIDYCDQRNDKILKTIIYLVYGAQVRISEIMKIQIKDFHINENKIILPKGKAKIKNKSKTVLLDEPLKEYLLKLDIDFNDPDIQEYFFIGTNAPYAKSSFVAQFPIATSTIGSRFQKLKKDLGIEENKTLYGFKHTGNVNLLINGADLIELMYKNGHSKISQTETYARQLIEQVPEIKYIRATRPDIDYV